MYSVYLEDFGGIFGIFENFGFSFLEIIIFLFWNK